MTRTYLRKKLPHIISAFAFLATALLFFENRRQNAQLLELMSRPQVGEGKKQQDSYISGPVKNRILKGYPEIQVCYRSYLETKPNKLAGQLRVDWQIKTSGDTVNPEVIMSEFDNPSFEKCVTDKIASWHFPEPGLQKYVEHTFRFEAKNNENKIKKK